MQDTEAKDGLKWQWITLIGTWLFLLTQIIPPQTVDPDLWGRLSVPALFFQNHFHFPYTDPFSFTFNGQPWIDHEWLSGFIFYGALALLGEAGLLLLKYFSVCAMLLPLFCLHKTIYQKPQAVLLYSALLLSPLIAFGYIATVRCQIVSFFFFAVFIWGLEKIRLQQQAGMVKLLVPALLIWSWCHGGFVLGLALVTLYTLGDWIAQRRISVSPYLKILLISIVTVSLINPYGPKYLAFIGQALTMQRLHVGEWQPLPLAGLKFWEVKLALLAALALLIKSIVQKRTALTPMLVLLFAIILAVKAIRLQPFLAITLLAYLPLFAEIKPPQAMRALLLKGGPAMCALASLAVLVCLNTAQPLFNSPIPDEADILSGLRYPVGAIRYLRQSHLSGNLMTPFPLGEFTYWSLFPQFRVSIDGRFEEVYTVDHFKSQYRFFKQPWTDAPKYADEIHADFILANQGFANHDLMLKQPGWEQVYQDFGFVVLARKKLASKTHDLKAGPIQSYSVDDFFTPADRKRFALKK